MSSEFSSNLNVSSYDDAWKEPVSLDSERFLFHKVRIYGTLQLCKSIRPEYAEDLVTVESLRKEFNIGIRLNHPSIVRYYRFCNNNLYEEYVDGLTIRRLIDSQDSRLEDPRLVHTLVSQLFSALDYLHKNGVVHRDIKPENLIMAHVGDRLKIIDFGAAESDECETTPGFTAANLAPEQTDGTASPLSDIFQAGLVLKALVSKTRLRGQWQKFIDRATNPDPLKRFRNAEEALEALPSLKKRSKNKVFGLIAVFLSVLVAGFILTNRYLLKTPASSEASETEVLLPHSAAETPDYVTEAQVPALPPDVTDHEETGKAAINEKNRLRSEIERFVTETYASNLKKICEETPPLDEKGFIVNSKMEEFEALYNQSVNQSFEFGESLASKNSVYRDFIEETLYKKMESVGSVYLSRFYKPNEIAVRKMGL